MVPREIPLKVLDESLLGGTLTGPADDDPRQLGQRLQLMGDSTSFVGGLPAWLVYGVGGLVGFGALYATLSRWR